MARAGSKERGVRWDGSKGLGIWALNYGQMLPTCCEKSQNFAELLHKEGRSCFVCLILVLLLLIKKIPLASGWRRDSTAENHMP